MFLVFVDDVLNHTIVIEIHEKMGYWATVSFRFIRNSYLRSLQANSGKIEKEPARYFEKDPATSRKICKNVAKNQRPEVAQPRPSRKYAHYCID